MQCRQIFEKQAHAFKLIKTNFRSKATLKRREGIQIIVLKAHAFKINAFQHLNSSMFQRLTHQILFCQVCLLDLLQTHTAHDNHTIDLSIIYCKQISGKQAHAFKLIETKARSLSKFMSHILANIFDILINAHTFKLY